ncbi:MAG: serine/threonine-protein kinase, partial [Nannocystaceae bacterium]
MDETGIQSTADSTLLADAETLVQTAGGTILDEDPAFQVERGAVVGRYTILDRLGAGAMGVVYTAYDPKLDRRIALKLLRIPQEDNGNQIVARLIREAQALAKLNHPNVVTIHDCDTIGDMVYLAMELVEGQNLTRWLRATPRALSEILRIFIQAGRGLAAAHEVGLVHRDFKPDNVLIGNDGRVRVADFGIARNVDEDPLAGPSAVARVIAEGEDEAEGSEVSTARLTQTGAVVGTPAYMAPEQHLGTRVDPRCDQFAFCVALYEALYGSHPFPAKSYLELRQVVLSGKTAAPPNRSDIPPAVRAAILRGLAVVPDRRFESMTLLLDALGQDPARRRTRWTLGVAAALIVAAVGATAYTVKNTSNACEGADRHLTNIWDEPARAAAENAFRATGLPYASKAWETSAKVVDRFAEGWVAMRTEACEATAIYHEQSTELLDRRMACLDHHLRRLTATTQ